MGSGMSAETECMEGMADALEEVLKWFKQLERGELRTDGFVYENILIPKSRARAALNNYAMTRKTEPRQREIWSDLDLRGRGKNLVMPDIKGAAQIFRAKEGRAPKSVCITNEQLHLLGEPVRILDMQVWVKSD